MTDTTVIPPTTAQAVAAALPAAITAAIAQQPLEFVKLGLYAEAQKIEAEAKSEIALAETEAKKIEAYAKTHRTLVIASAAVIVILGIGLAILIH